MVAFGLSLLLLTSRLAASAPPAGGAADVREIITTIANESEIPKWLDVYGYQPETGLFFQY